MRAVMVRLVRPTGVREQGKGIWGYPGKLREPHRALKRLPDWDATGSTTSWRLHRAFRGGGERNFGAREEQPLARGELEQAWRLNRRADFSVTAPAR